MGAEDLSSRWLARNGRRLAHIGIGHTIYATSSWLFDNVLYLYVIFRMGAVAGGALMTLLSLLICTATLIVYERMRIDWVGSGLLAELSATPNPPLWLRIVDWAQRRGSAVIFLALSIFQDPFITTAYFRQGRFDGLDKRDWRLFLASVVVSNLYWTLRSTVVVALLVAAWKWITS